MSGHCQKLSSPPDWFWGASHSSIKCTCSSGGINHDLLSGNVSNLLLIFLKGSRSEPFKKINNRSSTAPCCRSEVKPYRVPLSNNKPNTLLKPILPISRASPVRPIEYCGDQTGSSCRHIYGVESARCACCIKRTGGCKFQCINGGGVAYP